MRAFNLFNDTEYTFDKNTAALWAVCYAHCMDHNLASALFSSAQDGRFLEFAESLPVVYGARSVACGNYAARIDQEHAA
jgi:hypothetical protein